MMERVCVWYKEKGREREKGGEIRCLGGGGGGHDVRFRTFEVRLDITKVIVFIKFIF